jgi:WD40 repeat protein
VAGLKTLGVTNFLVAEYRNSSGSIKIWNFVTRQLVREFVLTGEEIVRGNFSRTGDMAIGHVNGDIALWKMESGSVQTNFFAHRRGVSGVAFTPDGHILATGGQEGTAKLWDLDTHRELVTLKGHLKSVHGLDISPDASRLATAGSGGDAVKLWDMHTYQELITLAGEGSLMTALAFSPDGNKIVGLNVGKNNDLHLQIWRAPSWEEIKKAEAEEKK